MTAISYPEIHPGKKILKKLYVGTMLFTVGRAIQAAARVDREVKEEFDRVSNNFLFTLEVMPDGPAMLVGKDTDGKVRYMGWKIRDRKPTLRMKIKNIEAAFLMFTFQESTAIATSRDRLIVDGNLAEASAVVRVLNIVEVYLLPKLIAQLAVKRYPKWSSMSPVRKHLGRIAIYVRTFLGV